MAFDVQAIQAQIAAAPIDSPYPVELARAIVDDCFRLAGARPVPSVAWSRWEKESRELWTEQLVMLAHLLAGSSLRAGTVDALPDDADPKEILERFFAAVEPLTAEMVRANRFRQEEFLRKWILCVGGTVAGEAEAESQRRLAQLDYRQTLSEYERAEKAREAAAARRLKALKEAQEREAAARGYRE